MHKPLLPIMSALLIALSLVSTALVTTTAHAQDISAQQRAAYEARKAYNRSQSEYHDLQTRIKDQERHIINAQEELDELKSREAAAQAKAEQAKMKLDEKQKALNDVWELRDQKQ